MLRNVKEATINSFNIEVDVDTLLYVFCLRIIQRKGEINLVVSTDAGQYYVKQ